MSGADDSGESLDVIQEDGPVMRSVAILPPLATRDHLPSEPFMSSFSPFGKAQPYEQHQSHQSALPSKQHLRMLKPSLHGLLSTKTSVDSTERVSQPSFSWSVPTPLLSVPSHYKLERYHAKIPAEEAPLAAISQRIADFIRDESLAALFDEIEAKVSVETKCCVKLVLRLWSSSSDSSEQKDSVIVECMRETGCSFTFCTIAKNLLQFIRSGVKDTKQKTPAFRGIPESVRKSAASISTSVFSGVSRCSTTASFQPFQSIQPIPQIESVKSVESAQPDKSFDSMKAMTVTDSFQSMPLRQRHIPSLPENQRDLEDSVAESLSSASKMLFGNEDSPPKLDCQLLAMDSLLFLTTSSYQLNLRVALVAARSILTTSTNIFHALVSLVSYSRLDRIVDSTATQSQMDLGEASFAEREHARMMRRKALSVLANCLSLLITEPAGLHSELTILRDFLSSSSCNVLITVLVRAALDEASKFPHEATDACKCLQCLATVSHDVRNIVSQQMFSSYQETSNRAALPTRCLPHHLSFEEASRQLTKYLLS